MQHGDKVAHLRELLVKQAAAAATATASAQKADKARTAAEAHSASLAEQLAALRQGQPAEAQDQVHSSSQSALLPHPDMQPARQAAQAQPAQQPDEHLLHQLVQPADLGAGQPTTVASSEQPAAPEPAEAAAAVSSALAERLATQPETAAGIAANAAQVRLYGAPVRVL